MKIRLFIVFIITSLFCYGNDIRSPEINEKFSESIQKIGELLIVKFKFEHFEEKELDIGFYSSEKSEINEKITNQLKEYLTLNGKELELNIINENYDELSEVLEKERNDKYEDVRLYGDLKKTKYLITVKTTNYEYKSNFYLKEDVKFNTTIELTNIATAEVMISKSDKFDFSKKTDAIYVYIISGGLFLLGILISLITHRYYTLKIMFFDIILITLLNVYFYML